MTLSNLSWVSASLYHSTKVPVPSLRSDLPGLCIPESAVLPLGAVLLFSVLSLLLAEHHAASKISPAYACNTRCSYAGHVGDCACSWDRRWVDYIRERSKKARVSPTASESEALSCFQHHASLLLLSSPPHVQHLHRENILTVHQVSLTSIALHFIVIVQICQALLPSRWVATISQAA